MAFFHLAAKNCLSECLKDPLGAASVNVLGTLNILEAARKANVRRVIYADTSAEYEGIVDFPTKESKIRPIGVYAASKHGGATFLRELPRALQDEYHGRPLFQCLRTRSGLAASRSTRHERIHHSDAVRAAAGDLWYRRETEGFHLR